jgi:hypothetical protein
VLPRYLQQLQEGHLEWLRHACRPGDEFGAERTALHLSLIDGRWASGERPVDRGSSLFDEQGVRAAERSGTEEATIG